LACPTGIEPVTLRRTGQLCVITLH
jgi:hypothetical protein